jgi:hypothetical protein
MRKSRFSEEQAIGTWVTQRMPLMICSPERWKPKTRNVERIPFGPLHS